MLVNEANPATPGVGLAAGERFISDPTPGIGQPGSGLLSARFQAGDQPGAYRPIFELIGGKSFQYTVNSR